MNKVQTFYTLLWKLCKGINLDNSFTIDCLPPAVLNEEN